MIIVEDVYIKTAGYTDEEMKIEIAVMLFEQERLSQRKAALMADMHWLNFMKELDKRNTPNHFDETVLDDLVTNLKFRIADKIYQLALI